MGIKQEVVHNENHQVQQSVCRQIIPMLQMVHMQNLRSRIQSGWVPAHGIIDADAIDVVQNIEMMLWEHYIPMRKLKTSMDTEMAVILNNKGGWLITVC